MNESPNPQPVYKQKQWMAAIIVVVVVIVGVIAGVLIKQAADAKSRSDAKAAAQSYLPAAKAEFERTNQNTIGKISPDGNQDNVQGIIDALKQATATRPRLAEVKGVGAEMAEYRSAKSVDQQIGSYYDTAQKYLQNDFLAFIKYAAEIQTLETTRNSAGSAITSARGGTAGAATAIRNTAIPMVQKELDKFKALPTPGSGDALKAAVIKLHQDYIAGLNAFAGELESGNIQNHDFSAQIATVQTELEKLSGVIQQKVDPIKKQADSIQSEF